jgi:hypothetical protein
MKEIELPINSCPLCDIQNIHSIFIANYGRARMYYCPNCGDFSISYMAYRFTPIINDKDKRSIISFYIRHNSNKEHPIFISQNDVPVVLENTKLPSLKIQLENLLNWFSDKSQLSMDPVDGNVSHIVALIGCKNQQQVIHLLDELWNEKFIILENPTTYPLRDRPHFDLFCAHLTIKGIGRIEELNRLISFIEFKPPQISLDSIFKKGENAFIEIKGSFRQDLNRYFKGDHKIIRNDDIALKGILRTIVAFLNTNGGNLLIGAIEKDKFISNDIRNIKYIEQDNFYIIGISLELGTFNKDKYELNIRDLISSHISKDVVDLVNISFPEINNLTLCHIIVNKANHKWYYLDNKFLVRDGNRTIELNGEESDNFKFRNKRL